MAWKGWLAGAMAVTFALGGCAGMNEPTPEEKVAAPYPPHTGSRVPVTVGNFVNRVTGAYGAVPGADRLGPRARDLLVAQIQESQRFMIVDAQPAPSKEPRLLAREYRLRSSEYQITGDINEIGRRETETGFFGGTKVQLAFVAVTVYVLDTQNSSPVNGARGFAEEPTGADGPDAAQIDRLLERAVRQGVKDTVEGKDRMRWGQELK